MIEAPQEIAGTRARKSRIFERHADDWYVEPSWVWTRLFKRMGWEAGTHVHDPACGGGTAVEAACRAGYAGSGSDVVARWLSNSERAGTYSVADFLEIYDPAPGAEVIVSNPPFKDAQDFAKRAMTFVPVVALLLPATWACGDTKARWLSTMPLSDVLFLTPRPTMMPGLGLLPGQTLGGGTKDYAIFVWEWGHRGAAEVGWLHRDGKEAAR